METPGFNPTEQQLSGELKITSYGKSLPSINHPGHNEDAIARNDSAGFAAVFDGMGGQINGEQASRAARNFVGESLRNIGDTDAETAKKLIINILIEASKKVGAEAPGGGTTAVAVKFIDKNRRIIVGSVGDSRAYLMREGKLRQITDDDNALAIQGLDLITKKSIGERLDSISSQAELDALPLQERNEFHSRNAIGQALDGSSISPHIYHVQLQNGDKIILTSDGIHDNLTKSEIGEIVRATPPERISDALVETARARSQQRHIRSKPDDVSVLVVNVGTADSVAPKDTPLETPIRVGTPHPTEVLPEKGAIVKVQRSDGTIDEGWELAGYNKQTGEARVIKAEGEHMVAKNIPQASLKALNRR